MFNSFLTQIGQRSMNNVLNTFQPAAHSVSAAVGNAITQPAQRYFHAAMNTPSMLDLTHPAMVQPTPHFQLQVPPPVAKKMSASQSRIEKRKQLKKQGPKRPSSAYFLFSMAAREDLVRQYPDAKVPELSKLASAKWKEMTDEEKRPYHDKFKINWEKYRVARKEYESNLPPKRPSGPFIQFTQEVRPKIISENPEKDLIEITKLIGEKWRSLSQTDKQAYTDTYKRKLKEWEEQYPEESNLVDAPKIES
ncbi:LAME_0G15258g1_1 [Lachancea meyersii CBS 8951]|uniref:LAME_0G15258g1_1 n=1 Tax=Lachancea meyersii CBS 8951 TaxID=1266667 RepID=A0A1G4KAN8_9SACH|nr:LAME_0G15258g1_1 [Lachancea meyersii CBS 8951]